METGGTSLLYLVVVSESKEKFGMQDSLWMSLKADVPFFDWELFILELS